MPRGLVLIPYITEYDHYERCSPGEAGMGWFRSILRFNRSVRRKVSTTRLHAGFRAFHEFEKFLEWYDNKEKQAEGVLPYGIYRLEWVEGKEDPKWIQFYEGCLNNLR